MDREEIIINNYIKRCTACGREVIEKEVTEVLSGGVNTAFAKVMVGVCQHCGERLYTSETIRKFEEIKAKLQHQDTAAFRLLGKSYQVNAFE